MLGRKGCRGCTGGKGYKRQKDAEVETEGKLRVPTRAIAMAWGTLVALVLLGQTITRASRPDGIDLTSYLLSARSLLHSASPYLLPTPFPYLYPPTLAFLLIPLTFVPPIAAVLAWFSLNAGAALWAVHRVALLVRPDLADRRDDVAVFLAVFFTIFLPILQSNLRNGQVNFIVLALAIAAALPAPTRTTKTPGTSTTPSTSRTPFFWAIGTSIKVLPIVLLPYFALRRRWPWMLQAAMFCAALLLLPAIVLDERIFDVYRQYRDVMQAASFGLGVDALDFSLAGTVAALTRTPLTPALRFSAAAVVLGWILQADGRGLRQEPVRPLALYLLAIPLASPKSEVHHLAFALPAAAMIAAESWRPWQRNMNRTFVIAITVAAALYVGALASPVGKGPMYCVALVGTAVALMRPPREKVEQGDGTTTLSVIQQAVLRRVHMLDLPPGARILDAPCGAGDLTLALRDEGYLAEGVDIEPAARERLGEAFTVVDLSQRLPWEDSSFDAVLSIEGIEHLENRHAHVRELCRVLKPGRPLVLTTPNIVSVRSRVRFRGSGFFHHDPRPLRESQPIPLHHIGLMTFPDLRYALHAAGFRIVHVEATHMKPVSYLYAPLVPWMWLYTKIAFRKERDAVQRRANREIRSALFSCALLFGENAMITARRDT